jgi:isoleucyl-tRNA synthetase
MFQPVQSKVNFIQLENRILDFWKKNSIFKKSVDARSGATPFILYEGPPTANGSPGIHHVLSRVFKDVLPRYKAMKGYYTPRIAGWDTHGLPVELEIEKKLGFSTKAEIETYGIAQFNALCRESVFAYLEEWNAITERIGFWLDLEHPYITLKNEYIESCWWAIKQLWDKGLVYQGYKVTPHCPRCGTSLSSHEVALGYKDDTEDPSVYIKFKLAGAAFQKSDVYTQLTGGIGESSKSKPVYFLAWTTTPWTLPGNTALAVAPDADYVLVELANEHLILADALLGYTGLPDYEITGRFRGESLVGLAYEPLFNPDEFDVERRRPRKYGNGDSDITQSMFELQHPDKDLTYHIIAADFVSMDDGTGIVHIAPAFGEVDFQAGRDYELDFVQPVDLEGKIIGSYPFAGRFVKDADPLVLDYLNSKDLLFRSEKIVHTYPFCWRCDAPLLYYAKKTWYIRTTAKKSELLAGNSNINWYPEHIKEGRFGNWLENNIDWAFSRERYWGTPLNVWCCTSCGSYECVGSLEDLKSKKNVKGLFEPLDLHRPFVDSISFVCPECGGEMNRQTEVIDCWFDSGAMPFAQWHYPFESSDIFKQRFPADFICEAVDQTRGWFYSLHAISTIIFNEPCFENVICLGHILDAEGEKMSKARGNVVEPWSVIDSYGADAIRWYLLTSSPAGNVRRFSSDIIGEVVRNFLLTLWNTYSFFVMYANIDNFDPKASSLPAAIPDLDRWILARLNQLIIDVEKLLDNYDPTTAGRRIEAFVNDISNWYVRRSRRRFWKSQNDADKMSAYTTLYNCLVTVCKLLAPFTPFIAEEMYQNLVRTVYSDAEESVHIADFPAADRERIDKRLIDTVDSVITICSLGRSARAKAGVKVRQPLSKVMIKARSSGEVQSLGKLADQILEELNVKELEFVDGDIPADNSGLSSASEGDYRVALVTELSPELRAEGTAREVVRRLQTMRRSAGLDITDTITVYYEGEQSFKQVIAPFADYIKQETLAKQMISGTPPDGFYTEKHKLQGLEILFGINQSSQLK